jgi:hypothetical protein
MMVVRMDIQKEINYKRVGDWEREVKGWEGFQDDRNGLEFGVSVQNMLDVEEKARPLV